MSEYESADFETLVDAVIKNENPREELDKMFENEGRKLQAVNSALKKLKVEYDDLNEIGRVNFSDDEIARIEIINDDIATFQTMKAELEAALGKNESTNDHIHDHTDKDAM